MRSSISVPISILLSLGLNTAKAKFPDTDMKVHAIIIQTPQLPPSSPLLPSTQLQNGTKRRERIIVSKNMPLLSDDPQEEIRLIKEHLESLETILYPDQNIKNTPYISKNQVRLNGFNMSLGTRGNKRSKVV